jgi:hypothetical protein
MKAYVLSVVIVWSMQSLYGPPLEDAGGPTESVMNIKTVASPSTPEQSLKARALKMREEMHPLTQQMKGDPKQLSVEDMKKILNFFTQLDGIFETILKGATVKSVRKSVDPESPYQYARDIEKLSVQLKEHNSDGKKDMNPEGAQNILKLVNNVLETGGVLQAMCQRSLIQEAANTHMAERDDSTPSEDCPQVLKEEEAEGGLDERLQIEGWETVSSVDAVG